MDARSISSATIGLVTRPEIAADLRVCPRQVIRYEKLGLPCLHLGKKRLYDREKVRAWLLGFERRGAELTVRGPGRPRRTA